MLIGLVGKAGAGKDTLAEFLVEYHDFTRLSFADALKNAVLALDPIVSLQAGDEDFHPGFGGPTEQRVSAWVSGVGWDRAKREIPEVRRLLQVMGTEVGRQILGENVWVDLVEKQIAADPSKDYVITDVRFPNEVNFVREEHGIVVEIRRPNNPDAIAATHASEQLEVTPDFVVQNDSTLTHLQQQASSLAGWARWLQANPYLPIDGRTQT